NRSPMPGVLKAAALRGAARRRPPPGSGLGRPRPARARLRALRAALIRPLSAQTRAEGAAIFLAADCPSRGYRVKGACGVACDRFATPDTARAQKGMAAIRKTEAEQ